MIQLIYINADLLANLNQSVAKMNCYTGRNHRVWMSNLMFKMMMFDD